MSAQRAGTVKSEKDLSHVSTHGECQCLDVTHKEQGKAGEVHFFGIKLKL